VAGKKDKLFRLKKQVERNARLNAKEIERKEKVMQQNENIQRELHFRVSAERELIDFEQEQMYTSMAETHMISRSKTSGTVLVPKNFSLVKNYAESLQAIQDFASALFNNFGEEVKLDFRNCQVADTPALFLMRVNYLELMKKIRALQAKLVYTKIIPRLKINPSVKKDVNRLLISTGYLLKIELSREQDNDSLLDPIDDIGYLQATKAQKHYQENKKGPYAKKIADYMDECLGKHDYAFSPEFKNSFEGIIAEVLSNAEDHTTYPTWFITANFSQEDFRAGPNFIVGEINLTILNFGNSMYEGFLETEEQNVEMFSKIYNFVSELNVKHPGMPYTEEQLFTMAMLQDQVSRLKYRDESRGTGTIKFITSFLDLGDYHSQERGYIPNLSIFSGHTHVNFDHTLKPVEKDGIIGIALNEQGDLRLAPDEKYLKVLKNKFPGTLFSVKMYLNKAHFDKKYGGLTNERV
jgi:hypothetical protein